MPVFNENIAQLAQDNPFFRKEIFTNEHSQLVLMSVEPSDDIGEETHEVDQILFFVSGEGESIVGGKHGKIGPNSLVSVPAGTLHNFINKGKTPLKLFTVYAGPEEEPGTLHHDKAEAEAAEAAKE